MKEKIIQLSSTSASFFLNSGKGSIDKILKDDWFAQVAKQIKKFYPKTEVECWAPEKSCKKEVITEDSKIKFRIFPSTLSIRPGMELSFSMVKALMEEIKKAEKENKKLILHIHEYHSWQAYLVLYFIKKNKNIKIVAQHHGGRSPFKNLNKYKRLLIFFPVIALMQFFENLLFKEVDIFYALSDKELTYLKNKTNGKIKFQTMGIPEELFGQKNKQRIKKELGLEENKKYILYVGRIKTTKGIKELLDAIKKLPGTELILIGRGDDAKNYEEYARQKGIKNANFLGAIYGDKRLGYYDACDCLILPSYTEGAPVVLMEAIAKNLPVIATNVGGVAKMIESGREGIIIKPKSSEEITKAIREILNWKKKNIKKYAKKYKWENIIKETIEDYKTIC
jgi:glycosyltransferase involved in cell wall biosynthesis